MKKLVCLILSMMIPFIFFSSCKPKIDIGKETEAIKALIYGETQAFINNDMVKVLSYYIQDDYQTRLSADCDTFSLYRGWDELSTFFKTINMTGLSNVKNTKDFFQIKVIDDAAWALYKDNWIYSTVETDTIRGSTRDTIITSYILCTMNLEKKANEWKISGFSIYSPDN
jgi:hypothetical protein